MKDHRILTRRATSSDTKNNLRDGFILGAVAFGWPADNADDVCRVLNHFDETVLDDLPQNLHGLKKLAAELRSKIQTAAAADAMPITDVPRIIEEWEGEPEAPSRPRVHIKEEWED